MIGASGNVATCTVAGWAALRAGAFEPLGLTTMAPPLDGLGLVDFDDIAFGGSEVRDRTLRNTLDDLVAERVLGAEVAGHAEAALADCQRWVCRGVEQPAGSDAVQAVREELERFKSEAGVDRLIVLNLASTEANGAALPARWDELATALRGGLTVSPSVVYALAAFETGAAFINFTPSLGSAAPALCELAEVRGMCHAGRDGKTGETLIKTALAPMFAVRRLHVDSWFSQNVLGNNDGRALSDRARREAKLETKRAAVDDILGHATESIVNIDYLPSFGDWKVAWNHIHFRGFGGTPMTMEFTWRGCDTALAAPLCIDLIRLVDRSMELGEVGVLAHLGVFFKSPMGSSEHRLAEQYRTLCEHCLGTDGR